MMVTILLVEDEEGIRSLTRLFLEKQGYTVPEAKDGEEAIQQVKKINPDVILLDIEMPKMDGFEVCKELRKWTKAPIIFISCRKESVDKMTGFGVGGDDYLTKPFDFYELDARIQALLRRNQWVEEEQQNRSYLRAGPLAIDLNRCEVFVNEQPIRLLHKEYQLLIVLAEHPNQVWTAEQLYDYIWGFASEGSPQTIKVHISNLRRKLAEHAEDTDFIETIRGFGYRFRVG